MGRVKQKMALSPRSLLVTVAASLLIVLSVVMFEGPGSAANRKERAPQTAATRMWSIWNPSSWFSSSTDAWAMGTTATDYSDYSTTSASAKQDALWTHIQAANGDGDTYMGALHAATYVGLFGVGV